MVIMVLVFMAGLESSAFNVKQDTLLRVNLTFVIWILLEI